MREVAEFQKYLEENIPLVSLMGFRLLKAEAEFLAELPLSGNQNDKGTAFAGALNSALHLLGWVATTRFCAEAGMSSSVVLASQTSRFARPVTGAFFAMIERPEAHVIEKFQLHLKKKSKARIDVTGKIFSSLDGPDAPAVVYQASYVAL